MLSASIKQPLSLCGPQPLKLNLYLLVFLGGEDQALPAAEGETGGDSSGRTGCSLQEQRHLRFYEEPRPQPQSQQQPCPRQPQPEAEGAGCQGYCSSLRPPEHLPYLNYDVLVFFYLFWSETAFIWRCLKNVSLFFLPVSASADAHLQQGVQPGEQQCQWEQGEPQPRPSNPAR